jgi:hypothetical protein
VACHRLRLCHLRCSCRTEGTMDRRALILCLYLYHGVCHLQSALQPRTNTRTRLRCVALSCYDYHPSLCPGCSAPSALRSRDPWAAVAPTAAPIVECSEAAGACNLPQEMPLSCLGPLLGTASGRTRHYRAKWWTTLKALPPSSHWGRTVTRHNGIAAPTVY